VQKEEEGAGNTRRMEQEDSGIIGGIIRGLR
jgi:hypothetical protein